MIKGLYILDNSAYDKIYGEDERNEIAQHVDIYAPQQTPQSIRSNWDMLKEAQVIFSGWHMTKMDCEFLDAAPNLKAVFYAAGTVKHFVTDGFWKRNIVLCSAYAANAVPVAEFTLAQILSCLKRQYFYAAEAKKNRTFVPLQCDVAGCFRSRVGIISYGEISKIVIKLLKNFDINIYLNSGFVSYDDAEKLGVKLADIETIFRECDVVSLHSPLNERTNGMITGRHFEVMKKGASFINTARGAIVREDEMISVLKNRNDIFAMLDVTQPEPPLKESPLYDLPNVFITPHIAGSVCSECRRMAVYMISEFHRFRNNEPLQWQITKEKLQYLA